MNYIGKVFSKDNSKLTVMSIHSGTGKKTKYNCFCNVCNKDAELHPDLFVVSKRMLDINGGTCGCSPKYRYTEKQKEIVINRICKENKNHLKFISTDGPLLFLMDCLKCSTDKELFPDGARFKYLKEQFKIIL